MSLVLPPRFFERPRDREVESMALKEGFTPLQSRILAGRLKDVPKTLRSLVQPRLADLDTPQALPDIEIAAHCIADAVQFGKPIAIVTDHDADGATSHAIIRLSLYQWGVVTDQVAGYISHRMREGYGVSHALIERILPELPPNTCVITADQGSTDEARIAVLRSAGHVVVVTDHHGVPDEGPPRSAHAVVNPARLDSRFPDRAIAGCHTALLVMAAARSVLVARGVLPPSIERVSGLLDLCAVGTIADASSLGASHNNRAIVQRGLYLMNHQPRACWNAMRRVLGKKGGWTVSDIAFQLASRINALGRLGDAMLGVEFLSTDDEGAAYEMALELDVNNRERRRIEHANTLMAMQAAQLAVQGGRYGLCLWLGEEGHAGVHGISASRVVERFGRPTICLSPIASTPDVVTGSVRTTDCVHVRNTLVEIQNRWPGLLVSAGGHAGAGGLRLRKADIQQLVDSWDLCVRECYGNLMPGPELLFDGDIERPTLIDVEEITSLEPFGRGFDEPVFFGEWRVRVVRAIGDGTHLKLTLERGSDSYDAVWFGAKEAAAQVPIREGQSVRVAYTVESNVFRGTHRLQLLIKAVEM